MQTRPQTTLEHPPAAARRSARARCHARECRAATGAWSIWRPRPACRAERFNASSRCFSARRRVPRCVTCGSTAPAASCCRARPTSKVMDLALRCGFAHCGRFSIEYRRRYGETPSQTLKRQAVFTGVLATMPSIFAVSRDRPTLVAGAHRGEPGERRDRPPGCRRTRHRADAGRHHRRPPAASGALSPDRRACAAGAGRRGSPCG